MSTTWQDAFEEFLLTKQAEGRSARTLKDYRKHVPAFFREHPDAWPDYHALKRAVVGHFAGLRDKSATYYNLRREYLKAFFSWCVRDEYIPKNPVEGIPKRKNDGHPRNIDESTLKRLLELPDKSTYAGVRDHALILFQLDTGIRPGEALQLLPDHFNLTMMEVTIPSTSAKTRTSRTVVISPQTAKSIRRLLSIRPNDWGPDVPVFASATGRPMDTITWGYRIRAYAKALGVRITPYMLRHTSAIMFLRGGGHVFALQRQLGHTSLVMTRRYVNLADSDMHEQHAMASPVNQLLPQRTRMRNLAGRGK